MMKPGVKSYYFQANEVVDPYELLISILALNVKHKVIGSLRIFHAGFRSGFREHNLVFIAINYRTAASARKAIITAIRKESWVDLEVKKILEKGEFGKFKKICPKLTG